MGAHSDIGGGYSEGDLSDVSLMWIIAEAKKAGVKIDDGYLKANQYDSIENPIVHDSVGVAPAGIDALKRYYPERKVIWAADAKGPSMFDSPEHLKLVWKETLGFQNKESELKFQKAHDLVQEILKAKKDSFCFDLVPTSLFDCDHEKLLDEYYGMKTRGLDKQLELSDDRVIMYDSRDVNERIQINKYINWINTHYKTSITTQLEY